MDVLRHAWPSLTKPEAAEKTSETGKILDELPGPSGEGRIKLPLLLPRTAWFQVGFS
jgi:hypothetical protein